MLQNNRSKVLSIVYTVLIFINNFAYGNLLNLIGATLVDLSFVYNASLNTISYVNVFVYIGYTSGSFACYLYRYVNRQVVLGLTCLLMAICISALPYYGNLHLAFAMIATSCLGAGAWDSAQSTWLVEIWPTSNTALLQGLQSMYSLGSITSPLLASQFVYGRNNVTRENVTLTVADRMHALTAPFLIIGVGQALVPIIILIMYFWWPFKARTDESTANSATTARVDPSSVRHRNLKLAAIIVCMALYNVGEYGYVTYSSSMLQYLDSGSSHHQHFSAAEAARVQSVLSASFAAGRWVAAIVSLKLNIDVILSYHYLLQLASLLTIYIGTQSATGSTMAIYIGTAGLGFGFSANYPGLYAFTEEHLRLTDRVGSLFVALTGTIGLVTPLVLGQTFKKHPAVLLFLTAAYTLGSFAMYLALKLWITLESRRNKGKSKGIVY